MWLRVKKEMHTECQDLSPLLMVQTSLLSFMKTSFHGLPFQMRPANFTGRGNGGILSAKAWRHNLRET